jgi:tight adherence protein C
VTGLAAIAAIAVGLGVAACAGLIVPPTARLRPRVRPYTLVARTALGYAPDVLEAARVSTPTGVFGRLFLPPLQALARRKPTGGGEPGDERLQRLLVQSGAGADAVTVQDFRIRQIGTGVSAAVIGGVATALLVRSPVAVLVVVLAAYTVGSTRSRKHLERAVLERARRIRQELYTVNHLLAMHVRTGSGPIQAVQRIVDRGRGAVVEDFAALLAAIRHGSNEAEAFRHAADLTPEPSAARTYQLLAASSERGSDLGVALLALSEDIRDARREQLHKDAVRRRAAMLVPTIAILAPIMLLFIAAPLPSIVLGYR